MVTAGIPYSGWQSQNGIIAGYKEDNSKLFLQANKMNNLQAEKEYWAKVAQEREIEAKRLGQ